MEEFEGIRKAIQDKGGKFVSTTVRGFTKEDFEEMILACSENFSKEYERTFSMVGVNFLESYRREYGDVALYNLITTQNLMGGSDVWNYIMKFKKEYEATVKKTKKTNVRNKKK